MNVAGHDADLDLVWRDNAGAVRPEQQRLPALHAVTRANHVADRDTLGDADHQIELRVDGFVNRCRRKRRWYIDNADRRAGGLLSFAYRRINRNALEVLARLFRIDPGDEALFSVGIIAAHAGMELARLAGNSLRDDFGILVDQNAHSIPSCRRPDTRGFSCDPYQVPRRAMPRRGTTVRSIAARCRCRSPGHGSGRAGTAWRRLASRASIRRKSVPPRSAPAPAAP